MLLEAACWQGHFQKKRWTWWTRWKQLPVGQIPRLEQRDNTYQLIREDIWEVHLFELYTDSQLWFLLFIIFRKINLIQVYERILKNHGLGAPPNRSDSKGWTATPTENINDTNQKNSGDFQSGDGNSTTTDLETQTLIQDTAWNHNVISLVDVVYGFVLSEFAGSFGMSDWIPIKVTLPSAIHVWCVKKSFVSPRYIRCDSPAFAVWFSLPFREGCHLAVVTISLSGHSPLDCTLGAPMNGNCSEGSQVRCHSVNQGGEWFKRRVGLSLEACNQ